MHHRQIYQLVLNLWMYLYILYFSNYKICFSEHCYCFFREEQTISANRNTTFIMCSDQVSYLFLLSIALLMVPEKPAGPSS